MVFGQKAQVRWNIMKKRILTGTGIAILLVGLFLAKIFLLFRRILFFAVV